MIVKSNLTLVLAALLLFATATAAFLGARLLETQKEIQVAISNIKAYQEYGDSLQTRERELLLTVEQLKYSRDRIDRELYAAAKELKIKDREILRLATIAGTIGKKDTITIKDTIFVKDLELDTTLSYLPHYKLDLSLKYPGSIIVSPSFYMDLKVVTSLQRETVNPPHKFFFVRWFQKKQNVVVVNLQNKNPYVVLKETRFIDIKK